MGVILSSLGLIYTANSLTQVFLVTAATFGAVSLSLPMRSVCI